MIEIRTRFSFAGSKLEPSEDRMPQTRRVLSSRQATNQKNVSVGGNASIGGKASTSLVTKKRASNDDSKRDTKRAALSEITNAVITFAPTNEAPSACRW